MEQEQPKRRPGRPRKGEIRPPPLRKRWKKGEPKPRIGKPPTRLIYYRSMKMTCREWAEFLGITSRQLWRRLEHHKEDPDLWPMERVMRPWPNLGHDAGQGS